jgi:ethanolamine permease
LPKGIIGVAWCLPFAVWFFVVIEIITLSPEDSANIETHIPKAFYASFATILLVSFLVLFLASGVGKGAADIAIKNNAYQYALAFVTDNQLPSFIFILLILTGPLAGFHSTIFAASRVSYSLGRAGYLPQGLASMSEKRQTPHSAIIFTSLLALVILVVTNLFAEGLKSIAILLNMAILGAIISYTMTFTSYVVLSVNYPKMKRPYVSPLGVTGAVAGLIISGITTALMFTNPEFLLALGVCVLVICIGLIYYFTIGKKNIKVDEPEEAFSINLHSHHHMGE